MDANIMACYQARSLTPLFLGSPEKNPANFKPKVRKQMRVQTFCLQEEPTFHLPCLAPENMLVMDERRLIAAFVVFHHKKILRYCPETHVWVRGEFYHSIFRVDGMDGEPVRVTRYRQQKTRKPTEILSSFDLLRHFSLEILLNGSLRVTDDQGRVFTY